MVSKKKNVIMVIGNLQYKENFVLGSGYSGDVKQVEDENGRIFALKTSNEKTIRFCMSELNLGSTKSTIILPEAAEFEKMRKLYAAGVPIPRPYGFQLYSSAEGVGNTAVLMDLIKGETLRDWLSNQVGGVFESLSGRSVHPVFTYQEAQARIDVAISIISSLIKLRRLAFFADFKPRNIMIKEQKMDKSKYFCSSLIDIGGIVMFEDVSTNNFFKRVESDNELQSTIFLHPIKDRYLIETTCSYLSPEIALLISEYDLWRGKLQNHYFQTVKDSLFQEINVSKARKYWEEYCTKNPRFTKIESLDMYLFHNYLEVRKTFKDWGTLMNLNNFSDMRNPKFINNLSYGNENVERFDNNSNRCSSFVIPNQYDVIRISEKSTVFTMGLILSELFGGKRTGLTALTRLKTVNEIFMNVDHNVEFRIVMEWERPNACLHELMNTRKYTKQSFVESNENIEKNRFSDFLNFKHMLRSTNDSEISSSYQSYLSNKSQDIGISSDDTENEIVKNSYFNLYRIHGYPNEGILCAKDIQDADPMNAPIHMMVKSILDSSLRGNPDLRPSLNELLNELQELKRLICVRLYKTAP